MYWTRLNEKYRIWNTRQEAVYLTRRELQTAARWGERGQHPAPYVPQTPWGIFPERGAVARQDRRIARRLIRQGVLGTRQTGWVLWRSIREQITATLNQEDCL